VGWWIGVLFMVGATCFAVGARPGYVEWVGTTPDNVTFFVGALLLLPERTDRPEPSPQPTVATT
jgi:hypothetical protein